VSGSLNILVLNAGIMGFKVLMDIDKVFYDAHFTTSVKGQLFLAKTAAPLLLTHVLHFFDGQ
jgi:NAD(P)-dependent dehydrogenase (short-subunit alcohol dehydrogenase family)